MKYLSVIYLSGFQNSAVLLENPWLLIGRPNTTFTSKQGPVSYSPGNAAPQNDVVNTIEFGQRSH